MGSHLIPPASPSAAWPPLIVAITMEPAAAARLTDWRQRFFPPERNYLAAHLMLYHRLPGAAEPRVRQELASVAAATPLFPLPMTRLEWAPGFAAVKVESEALHALKRRLDKSFAEFLAPQDRHGYRPHVTLINKVSPAQALAIRPILTAEFSAFTTSALGLELHAYAGGPWNLRERFAFPALVT